MLNRKASGIYRIVNIKDNHCYVGSAIHFGRRRNGHFSLLRRNKHHSIALQRAWNKYGEDIFKFEILSTCPKEYLLKLEQWFLDNLKPKYNCLTTAGSRLGFKPSPETAAKISKKNKGKVSHNKGNVYSKEFKDKLSKAHNHEKIPVCAYTFDGQLIKRYSSINEAILEGFHGHCISRVIKGLSKHHKKLIWRTTLK